MSYRVVVDTNLIISAFLWGGLPFQLLGALIANEIPLLASDEMIAELDAKLRGEKFTSRFQDKGSTPDQVMEQYRRIVEIVTPADIPKNVVRDPKDQMILSAAVGGEVSHLISGDKT